MAGVLLVLTLVSCNSKNPVWISEADNGTTIAVVAGDTLEVQLWGNPTTGYTWNPAALTTNVLVQQGDPEYVVDSGDIGSGGMYYFCYRAEAAGHASLTLTYHRVFEPNEPPAKVFQVTIVIQP